MARGAFLSASGRSPLRLPPGKNSFSREFALRAQVDKMSALPSGPGADLTADKLSSQADLASLFLANLSSRKRILKPTPTSAQS